MRALDNLIEFHPRRRIAENFKYLAVKQRLDHRGQDDAA
jgi:hypothetical protein